MFYSIAMQPQAHEFPSGSIQLNNKYNYLILSDLKCVWWHDDGRVWWAQVHLQDTGWRCGRLQWVALWASPVGGAVGVSSGWRDVITGGGAKETDETASAWRTRMGTRRRKWGRRLRRSSSWAADCSRSTGATTPRGSAAATGWRASL